MTHVMRGADIFSVFGYAVDMLWRYFFLPSTSPFSPCNTWGIQDRARFYLSEGQIDFEYPSAPFVAFLQSRNMRSHPNTTNSGGGVENVELQHTASRSSDERGSLNFSTQPQENANIALQEDIPPDGGYGWVCTVCVFLINAHTWGVNGVRDSFPSR